MFGFGMPELIVILVILLVVAGPSKLPQLGQSIGAALRDFRKATREESPPLPDKQ
jgi:sec-independent protein translocase protein TatA